MIQVESRKEDKKESSCNRMSKLYCFNCYNKKSDYCYCSNYVFFDVYMGQKFSHGMYVETIIDFSFLGLPVMAEGGEVGVGESLILISDLV